MLLSVIIRNLKMSLDQVMRILLISKNTKLRHNLEEEEQAHVRLLEEFVLERWPNNF